MQTVLAITGTLTLVAAVALYIYFRFWLRRNYPEKYKRKVTKLDVLYSLSAIIFGCFLAFYTQQHPDSVVAKLLDDSRGISIIEILWLSFITLVIVFALFDSNAKNK